MIQKKTGIPADEQILTTPCHREFSDDRTLWDYNFHVAPETTVNWYQESERGVFEARQAELQRTLLEEYLEGLLSLPLKMQDSGVKKKIAETKEKLGITPKNPDPAESMCDYTLRRRRRAQ
ncbi:hypothetical protein M3Y98_00147000 [Aphelenchoides besseyi]|nr:hypothetical protein M3Y98_00147000 [Aphelenchoides besseyi]